MVNFPYLFSIIVTSVRSEDLPPTACNNDKDCGGSERGRCIKNWPEDTNNEELARMLLPDFKAPKFWAVCQCKPLPTGQMPKGPRCEEGKHETVHTGFLYSFSSLTVISLTSYLKPRHIHCVITFVYSWL